MARLAGRFEGKPLAAPNLTPLVGVLLALFAGLAGLTGAAEATTALEQAPAVIYCGPARHATVAAVRADGSITFDGRPIGSGELDDALAGLAAADRRLALWAQSDADYGAVEPLVVAACRGRWAGRRRRRSDRRKVLRLAAGPHRALTPRRPSVINRAFTPPARRAAR